MALLVDRLKSSAVLQPPSPQDTNWFASDTRPSAVISTPAAAAAAAAAGSDPKAQRPRSAALAIVLRQVHNSGTSAYDPGRVEILLIKRAVHPRDPWSGHVALPGGRQEIGETELQAAVRECEEEVGISLVNSRFALLGRLRDRRTSRSKSALTVSCFVFVQTDSLDLPTTIQASEVAYAWWVDTAMFYPQPVPSEIGFAVTTMVKASRKPHWKALMRLARADKAYFPCFFLPPPPSSKDSSSVDSSALQKTADAACTDDPHSASLFVLWGLTFGVISDLVVAGGGEGFALKAPPYFRFRSVGVDFALRSFYKLQTWGESFGRAVGSTLTVLRLRQ